MRPASLSPTLILLGLAVACTGAAPAPPPQSTTATDSGSPEALGLFSFFVTSQVALQELSGSEFGFGGDLSYGETGPGAGLRGADLLCSEIAERSMPGSSVKQWRAFLSADADPDGQPVDAIDRIGDGPWYDRIGRLVAPTLTDLAQTRPEQGDPEIADDLPNENGVPNSEVDPGADIADERNHHILTGSWTDGTLYPARCFDEAMEGSLIGECMDECHATGGLSLEYYECEECELPIEDEAVLTELCRIACEGLDGYPTDCDSPRSATCQDWTTAEPDPTLGQPRVGLSWPRPDRTVDQEWLSWTTAGGCAPVGSTGEGGSAPEAGRAGSYGGFYCFALEP